MNNNRKFLPFLSYCGYQNSEKRLTDEKIILENRHLSRNFFRERGSIFFFCKKIEEKLCLITKANKKKLNKFYIIYFNRLAFSNRSR